MKFYREDPELMDVLTHGSQEDLGVLVDIITNKGKGRISLDSGVLTVLLEAKHKGAIEGNVLLYIAEEIQKSGANSIVSVFRGGKGVTYREVLFDVARHLKVSFNASSDLSSVENGILLKIIEKAMEKMSEEEKKEFFSHFGVLYDGVGPVAMAGLIAAIKSSGFFTYKLALIVANAVAKAVIGRGLSLAANAALMRTIALFAGPIGWAITAIWTILDIAGPAYRVTVPCVVQIAYMRQKDLIEECSQCHSQVVKSATFCSECGHRLH